jgi:hypothetical protein
MTAILATIILQIVSRIDMLSVEAAGNQAICVGVEEGLTLACRTVGDLQAMSRWNMTPVCGAGGEQDVNWRVSKLKIQACEADVHADNHVAAA